MIIGASMAVAVYAIAWNTEVSDWVLAPFILLALGLVYSGGCAYADHAACKTARIYKVIRGY